MQINGYEINISEEKLNTIIASETLDFPLVSKDYEGYLALKQGDKQALEHLVKAAEVFDDVALEQDNPLNRTMKKALVEAAKSSDYAKKALFLFNSFSGVAGLNGVDKDEIEIFKGIRSHKGRNFYPTDLDAEELHQILIKMLKNGRAKEVGNLLSARTMVRRLGDELVAIDYATYFSKEFQMAASELETAAALTTDKDFSAYLLAQAKALLVSDNEQDAVADILWANLQDSDLEFTLGRENYDDEITTTIADNAELMSLLNEHKIEVNSKDMLGARVGIINKKGTELILRFKEKMVDLAKLMPFSQSYTQAVAKGDDVKQTMVDVDLVALCGDYAQCRGALTTAQNLPNNDKLSLQRGGGRRNVYHRQVRMRVDKEQEKKLLDALVSEELHKFYNKEADHLFVIGHENGHSFGPDSRYQNALGVYKHIIEEHKADVVSIAFMPEYAKSGVIDENTLKSVYVSWVAGRLFLKAPPQMMLPHRMADLMQFNYLLEHGAISFDADRKLYLDFEKFPQVMNELLEETIEVQLSKSPQKAKDFIDRWTTFSEISAHIAKVHQSLGLKPYKEIKRFF